MSTSSHQLGNQEGKYLFSELKFQQVTFYLGFNQLVSVWGLGLLSVGLALVPYFHFSSLELVNISFPTSGLSLIFSA